MDNNLAVYGVDVSKGTLVVARYDSQTVTKLDNRMESITAWLMTLPKETAIAMEATGSYHQLLAQLAHASGMQVYVLNPQTLKHYAQAIGQRGKTDPCDARMIVRYAVHERAKLRLWRPLSKQSERLSQLLERRHVLVVSRQTLVQSLCSLPILKVTGKSLLASLERTLKRVETLIRHEIDRIPGLQAIYDRLLSIVGVGPVVAAQLAATFSALNFQRISSFIAYTGLDPCAHDSGNRTGKRRLSKHGPPLLRCQLFNAGRAAATSKLFKPYYRQLLDRGLQTTEAIVILARKIARIAFSVYKSGNPFDPEKHLKLA